MSNKIASLSKKKESKKVSKEEKNTVENPDAYATRQEVFDAITQCGENIDIVQQGLVEAVNTMYGQQVFPFQMEIWALENLLIDKGLITKEEIDAKIEERRQDLLSRAEEIREKADGSLEVVPKEEAEIHEKEAVVKANLKKSEQVTESE